MCEMMMAKFNAYSCALSFPKSYLPSGQKLPAGHWIGTIVSETNDISKVCDIFTN